MKEIKGDLLKLFKQGKFDMIAHGCNCQNIMGAGIAKQIKEEFPKAFKADCIVSDVIPPEYKLGSSYIVEIGNRAIVNMYTQLELGKNFSIANLFNCMDDLVLQTGLKNININNPKKLKLGLPLIGCGIGGGYWKQVKKVLKVYEDDFDITIVHYDSKIEGLGEGKINLFS